MGQQGNGFGTYKKPPGTWSDDSSMILVTLDSIRDMGKIESDDIMKRFVDMVIRIHIKNVYIPMSIPMEMIH